MKMTTILLLLLCAAVSAAAAEDAGETHWLDEYASGLWGEESSGRAKGTEEPASSNFLSSLIGSIIPDFGGGGGAEDETTTTASNAGATSYVKIRTGHAATSTTKGEERQKKEVNEGDDYGETTPLQQENNAKRPNLEGFCKAAATELRGADATGGKTYERLWELASEHSLPVRKRFGAGVKQMALLVKNLCHLGVRGGSSGRDGIGGRIPGSSSTEEAFQASSQYAGRSPPPAKKSVVTVQSENQDVITVRPQNPLAAERGGVKIKLMSEVGSEDKANSNQAFVVSGGFSFGNNEKREKRRGQVLDSNTVRKRSGFWPFDLLTGSSSESGTTNVIKESEIGGGKPVSYVQKPIWNARAPPQPVKSTSVANRRNDALPPPPPPYFPITAAPAKMQPPSKRPDYFPGSSLLSNFFGGGGKEGKGSSQTSDRRRDRGPPPQIPYPVVTHRRPPPPQQHFRPGGQQPQQHIRHQPLPAAPSGRPQFTGRIPTVKIYAPQTRAKPPGWQPAGRGGGAPIHKPQGYFPVVGGGGGHRLPHRTPSPPLPEETLTLQQLSLPTPAPAPFTPAEAIRDVRQTSSTIPPRAYTSFDSANAITGPDGKAVRPKPTPLPDGSSFTLPSTPGWLESGERTATTKKNNVTLNDVHYVFNVTFTDSEEEAAAAAAAEKAKKGDGNEEDDIYYDEYKELLSDEEYEYYYDYDDNKESGSGGGNSIPGSSGGIALPPLPGFQYSADASTVDFSTTTARSGEEEGETSTLPSTSASSSPSSSYFPTITGGGPATADLRNRKPSFTQKSHSSPTSKDDDEDEEYIAIGSNLSQVSCMTILGYIPKCVFIGSPCSIGLGPVLTYIVMWHH